ncbi:hypothetical protein BRDID11004_47910 [Bradyrhizobium diazoefficiens]|uniref:Uncharacterized protein n=1 Tax=Bradyrhizobium diazoefficiens TaxID=1355477 RepID=A0A809ZVU7_9BRAD|nr:hypothetical protein [Bradyrhizobium diazoefficiens]BBZ94306.1 hypothetical protein F07S3_41390 [Bradyrhizobium diazoefficiens]BCE56394.1 hypothetical protein XF5B_39060 [Bradyrhizobium diazoefficiens]
MTATFDAQALAGKYGLDRPGRSFAVEARASGFFVTGTDSGHRADAILHANQLTDPEAAKLALVGAIQTLDYMLDIDLAAEPA